MTKQIDSFIRIEAMRLAIKAAGATGTTGTTALGTLISQARTIESYLTEPRPAKKAKAPESTNSAQESPA